jgi:hypothetical protein
MKNISTGTGLCVLGLCLASYPIIDRVMPRADAGATHVAAVVAAATAQVPPEPTIVWYQTVAPSYAYGYWMLRAWSDGKIESRWCETYNNTLGNCAGESGNPPCFGDWVVISDANMGYNAASDINFDSKVNGADLSQVLNDWGNAPRQDIPPSTCPLNLINP